MYRQFPDEQRPQVQAWEIAAQAGDLGAALSLFDAYRLSRHEASLPELYRWARRAVELADPTERTETLWRLAEVGYERPPVRDVDHARWVMLTWGRAILAAYPTGGLVQVAPDVLGPLFRMDGSFRCPATELVLRVDSGPDEETLRRIGQRLSRLRDDGFEIAEDDEIPDDSGHWTVAFVSEPERIRGSDAWGIWFDDEVGSVARSRALLGIVMEEVVRAGLERPRLEDGPPDRPTLTVDWDQV